MQRNNVCSRDAAGEALEKYDDVDFDAAPKMADEDRDNKYLIRAAKKTLEALDLFSGARSTISASDLKNELGVNGNMAFRILYTLERARYIVFNSKTNKYHLSLKVFAMGRVAAAAMAINKIALPFMQLLAAEFPKMTIALVVFEQDEQIITERLSSNWLPKIYGHIGRTMPLHATGGGKALLSGLTDAELDRIIAKGLDSFTDKTITDATRLKRELTEIRSTRIAWEREEHAQNLNGIAAAIRDPDDKPVAALCLSGFSNYLSVEELEAAAPKLMETTFRISETLQYMK